MQAGYDAAMRLLDVPHNKQPAGPVADAPMGAGWLAPSAMGGKFSAMCWFFGRDLYAALGAKVPVGLVQTTWGGTPDQHWSSPDALGACTGRGDPWDFPANFTDSVLWNGMVVPLLRTTHSGAVWMQGEANARADGRQYNCSFQAMIADWRAKWHAATDGATAADFPFGWSQLNSIGPVVKYSNPPFDPASNNTHGALGEWDSGFPSIRLAESRTLAALPNTFQAVIVDTPVASGSVHSPFKQVAGQRLARGALGVAYGATAAGKVAHLVDPVATGAALSADGASLVVTVGGVPMTELVAKVGAEGFEVLGSCAGAALCWQSCKVTGSTGFTVTVGGLPGAPQAVRYLWYSSPCGVNQPYQCPVYAPVPPLGALSGEDHPLPLGPFIMKL